MIKCNDCGARFEDYEVRTRSEYVSEFWGSPAYAEISVCPSCGSDEIEETEEDEGERGDDDENI